MSISETGQEIQEEMNHVRAEIRDDVRGIIAGTRAMTDWRHYLRQYPWVAVSRGSSWLLARPRSDGCLRQLAEGSRPSSARAKG